MPGLACTGKHKADPHKGPGLCVSPLGLHANVDELPCCICLEHLGLAGRQDARERVPCANVPLFSAYSAPKHVAPWRARSHPLTLLQSWLIRQPCRDEHWLMPLDGQCKDWCKFVLEWD